MEFEIFGSMGNFGVGFNNYSRKGIIRLASRVKSNMMNIDIRKINLIQHQIETIGYQIWYASCCNYAFTFAKSSFVLIDLTKQSSAINRKKHVEQIDLSICLH